jgi:hypothetical protein
MRQASETLTPFSCSRSRGWMVFVSSIRCRVVLHVDTKFITLTASTIMWWSDITRNDTHHDVTEEIRWKVLKAMLDDFPQLRQRLKEYLQIGRKRQ